ncbi:hypothetical protein [Bradyrhizobium genosp. P]|uniref:hypothetical protein n=1 Tax=Bradyrhizobium genosp. P TaxID=83641 RepID=UPI003CFA3717
MPVAKIHVHEGAFDDRELSAIGLAVQAALAEVLSVPPEDYFRVTYVPPKGRFVHTPPSSAAPTASGSSCSN